MKKNDLRRAELEAAGFTRDPDFEGVEGQVLIAFFGAPRKLPSAAEEARASLRATAEGGHLPAMQMLGNGLIDGVGMPQDRADGERWLRAAAEAGYGGPILGADTIVVVDTTILNKPRDAADARRMLRVLAGRTHTVYTGMALLAPKRRPDCLFYLARSEVAIAPLAEDEIAAYVATGEPLDKAGAYGIQGLGGQLVQAVEGSYTAVVGLPLGAVHRLLRAAGIDQLVDPAEAFRRWLADQGKDVPQCTAP